MRSTAAFLEESCDRVRVGIESVFSWDYDHDDLALVRLYDKAKRSQWNAREDLDWGIDVDPSRPDRDRTLALVEAPDSPFARLDEAGQRELAWYELFPVSPFLVGHGVVKGAPASSGTILSSSSSAGSCSPGWCPMSRRSVFLTPRVRRSFDQLS